MTSKDCVYSLIVLFLSALGVYVTGRCFHFKDHGTIVAWNEANAACKSLGGALASLSRPDTWSQVWRVFQLSRFHPGLIHIGLKTTPRGLPNM